MLKALNEVSNINKSRNGRVSTLVFLTAHYRIYIESIESAANP